MSDIVFQRVSRSFKRDGREQLAVDDVSLEVREREFVALVGPSGCGKTTCLRMAAGLDFPSAGSVTVGGKKVEEPGPQRAVVFQQFALFPWKTISLIVLASLTPPRVTAGVRARISPFPGSGL